ncbi:type II secretion system protein, partial [bacterium]|nr:type II secretion system protein [bacterium]
LLVVIAIIGILSSVVLASLNSARNKGKDSSIQSQLNQIRAQASLYYDTASNTYVGLFGDTKVLALLNAAQSTSGGTATTNAIKNSWAAAVPLPYAGGYWCTDVTSFAGRITSLTNVSGAGATCN